MHDEQADNLQRVSSRIAASIMDFIRTHAYFHADDLRKHVTATVGNVAPGSSDRILRDLRQRGVIEYTVISRKDSFYCGQVVPKQTEITLTP